MVAIQSSWSLLDDCRLSIKTPRLVSPAADIFLYAGTGNISRVQKLFADQVASPFDVVADYGTSALHVCFA